MITRRHLTTTSLAALASTALGHSRRASAQLIGQPSRIVVGFTPGGSVDTIARLVAPHMGDYAPTLIVDNRAGAGGRIGLQIAQTSPADGTTMVLTPASMMVIYPHVYKNLTYDPRSDFVPVAELCSIGFTVSIGPMVPAEVRTLADFIEWCKANPNLASYGTPGAGTMAHFVGVMLAQAANVDLVHVGYKGGAPAIQDLLGGQIACNILVTSNALPHVQAGKIRALATTGTERAPNLPDIPTAREAGFSIEAEEWFGMFMPKGTPAELVAKANTAINAALQTEPVRTGLTNQSFDVGRGGSPEQLAQLLAADLAKWGPVVKASGYTAQD